jgi:hypothetical protein
VDASVRGASRPRSYSELVVAVRDAVARAIPPGATAAVISKGDDDLVRLDRHAGWHFPKPRDRDSYHYPAASADAIGHLEELLRDGAQYLVIPATSSWWLDYYVDFRAYLNHCHRVVHDDRDVCTIYALDPNVPRWSARAAGRDVRAELVKSPIVIYGAPRSGTTYVRYLLSAHPEVFITNETRIFTWAHYALKEVGQLVMANRDQFAVNLREVLPQLIRDFYAKLAPQTARYWGDKNPHYARPEDAGCLELIADLFPGSRFIHVIRDGRDVVASLIRKTHADGSPWVDWEGAHRVWGDHLDVGCEFGSSIPRDYYFELRYEDLVRDDLEVARRVFSFLRLDLHRRVEDFCLREREHRTPFSRPTRELRGSASHSDWERLLSPEARLRSLERLGERLVRHGYETEDSLAKAILDLRKRTVPRK